MKKNYILLQKNIDNNKSVPYNIIVRKEWINMANQIFGIRVKDLREKSGLSMEQLATKLGVSKSRVNMWENNGTIPRGDVLIQLAKYFEVSTDYLLGNDDDSTISPTNAKLSSLQRNLGKLNEADLNRAEGMLKAVFMDIFNDEEDDDDI
jgi:transcriptional regulator with XRE-family HTH domain